MTRFLTIGAVLVMVAMLASGCAVLAPGMGASGGDATLGDAVAAATADSAAKVKRLDAGDTAQVAAGVEAEYATPYAPEPLPERIRDRRPFRPMFGVVGSGGFFGGSDYDGFGGAGLDIGGFPTGRVRWDILAMANDVRFAGESRLGDAFRNAVDLELDLTGRWYLTREHTFSGVYMLGGIGTGTLFWDYAKGVPVVRDGVTTTITDDRINHFEVFAGPGIGLIQSRHLHLGLNAVSGVRFYGWHTDAGFANDQLPATGFGRVLVELTIRP